MKNKILAVLMGVMLVSMYGCSYEEAAPANTPVQATSQPKESGKERKKAYYKYAVNCLQEIPVPEELKELGIYIEKYVGSDIKYFMADVTGDGKDELIVDCGEGALMEAYSYRDGEVRYDGSVIGGGVGAKSAWLTKIDGKYYIEEQSSSSSTGFLTKLYQFRDDIADPTIVHHASIDHAWDD